MTLDPTGFVELEGERRPARSEFTELEIPRGERVVVREVDSTYLIVRRVESEPPQA